MRDTTFVRAPLEATDGSRAIDCECNGDACGPGSGFSLDNPFSGPAALQHAQSVNPQPRFSARISRNRQISLRLASNPSAETGFVAALHLADRAAMPAAGQVETVTSLDT